MSQPPLIVLGAGGHSKVLISAVRLLGRDVLGLTDVDKEKIGTELMGLPIIGDDRSILKYQPQEIRLVNGIGTVRVNEFHQKIFEAYKKKGYRFESIAHPSAIIDESVFLGEGCQIMAGAIIQTGCHIGMNSIINTGAQIDHDSAIGNHVHVAPGAILSGGVAIGDGAHIGAGAVIIQGVSIGKNSLVAAGATVTKNVPDNVAVAGVPARELTK
jgi:UDP-perosamine 4-acetyltransferase